MMSKNADNLISLLSQMGLDEDQSKVFLYLNSTQPVGALRVSRDLKIPRTNIYRLLEQLIEKGLILVLEGEHGAQYQAISPEQLNKLRAEKEIELMELNATLAELIPELELQRGLDSSKSKVVHYRGVSGLRQLVWNTLAAETGLNILEISDLSQYLGQQFAEKVRQEFVLRQIPTRQITNEHEFSGWTKVKQFVQDYWQIRYLDKKELEIKFEVFIYNDVYALLNYDGGEMFGVEIHNPQLAKMQGQLFEYLWQKSQPMLTVDEQGAAKLKN